MSGLGVERTSAQMSASAAVNRVSTSPQNVTGGKERPAVNPFARRRLNGSLVNASLSSTSRRVGNRPNRSNRMVCASALERKRTSSTARSAWRVCFQIARCDPPT
jgi:hypothetical protein